MKSAINATTPKVSFTSNEEFLMKGLNAASENETALQELCSDAGIAFGGWNDEQRGIIAFAFMGIFHWEEAVEKLQAAK